jgi:hypothetical protein
MSNGITLRWDVDPRGKPGREHLAKVLRKDPKTKLDVHGADDICDNRLDFSEYVPLFSGANDIVLSDLVFEDASKIYSKKTKTIAQDAVQKHLLVKMPTSGGEVANDHNTRLLMAFRGNDLVAFIMVRDRSKVKEYDPVAKQQLNVGPWQNVAVDGPDAEENGSARSAYVNGLEIAYVCSHRDNAKLKNMGQMLMLLMDMYGLQKGKERLYLEAIGSKGYVQGSKYVFEHTQYLVKTYGKTMQFYSLFDTDDKKEPGFERSSATLRVASALPAYRYIM